MDFCDTTCRHAHWPEGEHLDGSGSCRTFQALYCDKKGYLVHKNAPCALKAAPGAGRKTAARPVPKAGGSRKRTK